MSFVAGGGIVNFVHVGLAGCGWHSGGLALDRLAGIPMELDRAWRIEDHGWSNLCGRGSCIELCWQKG